MLEGLFGIFLLYLNLLYFARSAIGLLYMLLDSIWSGPCLMGGSRTRIILLR